MLNKKKLNSKIDFLHFAAPFFKQKLLKLILFFLKQVFFFKINRKLYLFI